MSSFTVTVSTNTITISEGTTPLKNTNMPILGGSGGTTQWKEDIFFKFYTRFGGMTYFYSSFDLSGFTFTSKDLGMMLAALFPNLYNNANASTIQTDHPEFGPSFARLNGTDITVAPSYAFDLKFQDQTFTVGGTTDITNAAGWLFTQFGIGDKGFASTISGNLCASPVNSICLSAADPTNPTDRLNNGIYDEVAANAGGTTYIVYTNLFTAFSTQGMIHPYQFLAVWPIFARISLTNTPTKNPLAFIGTLFDTFFLRRGESTYFDRRARQTTTYGSFGNFLLSVFDHNAAGGASSWGIPVIAPFGSVPEYAIIRKIVDTYSYPSVPAITPATQTFGLAWAAGYSGSSPNKVLFGNVKMDDTSKVFRRLIMFYCAAVERGIAAGNAYGTDFITNTETAILAQNPSYPNIAAFYQAGAQSLANGEYAHFFKYAQSIPYGASNIFDTFVSPYITWATNVTNLPNTLALTKNFGDGTVRMFQNSIILTPIITIINTTKAITDMSGGEANNCITYSYTP